ncbi:MAG: class I SAM-dependent methyltransferase [Candidatus Limnocylindria bacterium]
MTGAGAAEAFSATAERYAESVAPALAPAAREVVGLDAAPGMLEIARRAYPGITFVEADFAAVPFPEGSFDVVIGVHAVMFAADPSTVMQELRRVTRPSGRLSVSAPGPFEVTPTAAFGDVYERFGLDVPRSGTSERDLAAWARDGGWIDIETDADPGYRLRLDGEQGVRSWLATGPRGTIAAAWDSARRDALVAALLEVAERAEDGAVLFPFGALYLTARRD